MERSHAVPLPDFGPLHEPEYLIAQRWVRSGAWSWDKQSDRIEASPEALQIFGIDTGALPALKLNDSANTLFPADEWQRLQTAAHRALETEQTCHLELRGLRHGGPVWLALRSDVCRDAAGRPMGLHGAIQDITAYRQLLLRLQQGEQEWRLAVAASRAAIWIIDYARDGIERFNSRACEIAGLDPSQTHWEPGTFCQLIHPGDREAMRVGQLATLELAGSIGPTLSYRILRRDGTVRHLTGAGTAQCDPAGRALRFIGVSTDVTELEEGAVALRQNEDRLRCALSAAHASAFEISVDSSEMSWIEGDYSLLPVVSDDKRENYARWMHRIHPADRERVETAARDSISLRKPYEVDYRLFIRPGLQRWIQARGVGVSEAGPHAKIVGALVDVTERREAEGRLREAARRKDEFLASLAHELRTPLGAVSHASEVISADSNQLQGAHWATRVIRRQVGHMARLLEDLLDVARITQGKVLLKTEQISLAAVLEDAVESVQSQIQAKAHHLVLTMPDPSPRISADPMRLAQVFSNLLNNAVKYTDSSGTIRVTARVREQEVSVSIQDNGMGLPPEALESIFQLFSQSEAARPRAEGGLGIGLALVKALVELHEGRVEARSEGLGRGSEFVVFLPFAQRQPK